MLDFDLAALYEVETRALNQAVKRNLSRFPEDFMFQLTPDEWAPIRMALLNMNSSQIVTSYRQQRGASYTPYALHSADVWRGGEEEQEREGLKKESPLAGRTTGSATPGAVLVV